MFEDGDNILDNFDDPEAWYEPENCEFCLVEMEDAGIQYIKVFTW